MTIKAIETEYNGYKFRSRLEARWAVFFDAAGIEYQYEPEGFELSIGKYLPDFYLPQFDLYVEIKPFDKSVVKFVGDGNEWERKCASFRDETAHAILLCYDEPAANVWKMLYAFDTCDSGGGCYENQAVFSNIKNKTFLVVDELREDRDIFVRATAEDWSINERVVTMYQFAMLQPRKALQQFCEDVMCETFNAYATDKLNIAKKVARQARFEHGETPVIHHE